MLVNMTEMVAEASRCNRIVPGFNVFGYEDTVALIKAAERFCAPVILMSNNDAIEHMSFKHSAALYRSIAESVDIPVVVHADHVKNYTMVQLALDAGYTSIMYDGSQLPLRENIENSVRVLERARCYQASVEAEIGIVPYTDRVGHEISVITSCSEVRMYTQEVPVDALAISVGSKQRMQEKTARINFEQLAEIEKYTDIPLVIHGMSGIVDEDIQRLCYTRVGKVNIGTSLRMTFGTHLKREFDKRPIEFDRNKFIKSPMEAIQALAEKHYQLLGWEYEEGR